MQQPLPIRRHHTPEQRSHIIDEYRRSGLTQGEFAAQAGIGKSTLTLWLRKSSRESAARPAALISVPNLFASTAEASVCRVQFPGGITVEMTPGFPSSELASLLGLVKAL